MNAIDRIYRYYCDKLIHAPKVNNTRELTNVCMTIDANESTIISIRDLSPAYLFGEWLWYFAGCADVEFISKYGSLWKTMTDDGRTVHSAYGFLIQKAPGFNQIETIIDLLQSDPDSRRGVININSPRRDVKTTNDEPCTIALQFYIRDHKLNCTAMMRSNDIWYGLPYDVAFFTELQRCIADRLHIELGDYTHFTTSLHVYEKDLPKLKEYIPSKPITFDRVAFHKRKEMIYRMIRIACEHCSNKEIRELTIKLAKEFFEYVD